MDLRTSHVTEVLDDEWLTAKVREVMRNAPTRPPYRVEVFNPKDGSFYVSGTSCNAFGVLSFASREIADAVAARANEIAGSTPPTDS